LPQSPQLAATAPFPCRNRGDSCIPSQASPKLNSLFGFQSKALAFLLPAVLLTVAGCAGGGVTAAPSNGSFSIGPGIASIDTNCTGCNTTNSKGASVEQFSARLINGDSAAVTWSLSGGDANSGPGSINASGQYTPPSYLTADRADVVLTAKLNSSGATATAVMTVTPGFLQPLTPENAALGANGQTTITGFLAEAGGANAVSFALASTASGTTGGQGSLGPPSCQRTSQAFTSCTVTYTAPPTISATGVTYVVATVEGSSSKAAAALLLNSAGLSSTPATHQAQLVPVMQLGVSGGHNTDYDTHGKQIADCCGGTLGSLIQDSNGRQFLLSNNHVLARSDQAAVGDTIVQPGLIDNNCTPYGDGPGTSPVGSLAGWLPLSSNSTNADAAIAQVTPGAVDPSGSILELGVRQADGTLGAAPPGISSTGGRGEPAALGLMVAKSGRTTGLTCASVSALDLDVNVDYYLDCAETKPYLTKTFTHQLAVSGNQFSDAGDSGSLLVNTADAEPVGLFFAGGMDAAGISQGVANPATDVLTELGAQAGGGTSYSFVGMADHAVSCLNYGDNTEALAQGRTLSDSEVTRTQQALAQARMLVNPSAGILGVGTGKSSDHPGEGAVIVYVDESMAATVPATVDGVRTLVIATNARAVALGSAPQMPAEIASGSVPPGVLNSAVAIKRQVARNLMRQDPAFFGVGVGESLDNPKDAALVIYVDRKKVPAQLPATINGLRTRYVLMDRLHVTRSYASPIQSREHCVAHPATTRSAAFDGVDLSISHDLHLN
jgi:hypothetical protein